MAVKLQKGQRVELRKSNGGVLKKVMVGLGWDEVEATGASDSKPEDIDCDASAFVCVGGRLTSTLDIVYYANLTHESRSVRHMGDNLTGGGEGDDEQIFVDLDTLHDKYDRIVFVVNIYRAKQRGQHFGMIKNAFIRICDAETDQELCNFNLSENYDGMTAMIIGELYLHNGIWKFNAIGQPTHDNTISDLALKFA